MSSRQPFEMDDYLERSRSGPCFVCELLAGNPQYHHHVVYEDDTAVAFLNKYPTLYGYTLVAPKAHHEQVTGDFSVDEYLHLQRVIYHIAEALRRVVPTERVYMLSLGSQQGNRHVHWHIAPLPPGVPYEEQQMEALQLSRGVLALPDEEMAALAKRIHQEIAMEEASS
ncbi:MAG TPA: HIT family protein [Ktedonobacterales bacterium]|jgi:diadenosine tetraphosphate (Ap4A) HIT family hydrolase